MLFEDSSQSGEGGKGGGGRGAGGIYDVVPQKKIGILRVHVLILKGRGIIIIIHVTIIIM